MVGIYLWNVHVYFVQSSRLINRDEAENSTMKFTIRDYPDLKMKMQEIADWYSHCLNTEKTFNKPFVYEMGENMTSILSTNSLMKFVIIIQCEKYYRYVWEKIFPRSKKHEKNYCVSETGYSFPFTNIYFLPLLFYSTNRKYSGLV